MAHRIFAPEIQALRGQKQAVKRQYRRDVRSNRGAINFTQQAISQVPLKGLTGKARQQVASEMALSSKDVAASLPFLNAEARAARTERLADIQSDIIGARVDQAQDAARRYASLLGQEATYQTGQAKARTDVRKDRRERRKGAAGNFRPYRGPSDLPDPGTRDLDRFPRLLHGTGIAPVCVLWHGGDFESELRPADFPL
jgi:hypothetical protein